MVTLLQAVGLERITPNISMYARTNRCYNQRGSRTNYVRSSMTHWIVNNVHTLMSVNRYDVHAFPILRVIMVKKNTVFSRPVFLKLCSNRSFSGHEL
jgi:hypothetical protein